MSIDNGNGNICARCKILVAAGIVQRERVRTHAQLSRIDCEHWFCCIPPLTNRIPIPGQRNFFVLRIGQALPGIFQLNITDLNSFSEINGIAGNIITKNHYLFELCRQRGVAGNGKGIHHIAADLRIAGIPPFKFEESIDSVNKLSGFYGDLRAGRIVATALQLSADRRGTGCEGDAVGGQRLKHRDKASPARDGEGIARLIADLVPALVPAIEGIALVGRGGDGGGIVLQVCSIAGHRATLRRVGGYGDGIGWPRDRKAKCYRLGRGSLRIRVGLSGNGQGFSIISL